MVNDCLEQETWLIIPGENRLIKQKQLSGALTSLCCMDTCIQLNHIIPDRHTNWFCSNLQIENTAKSLDVFTSCSVCVRVLKVIINNTVFFICSCGEDYVTENTLWVPLSL